MPINHIIYSCTVICSLISCIDEYNAHDAANQHKIVVDALLCDNGEKQTIKISYTINIKEKAEKPLKQAQVRVIELNNTEYAFIETSVGSGIYEGTINADKFYAGNAFKLSIQTKDDLEFESNFEQVNACPNIDTLYYEVDNEKYFGNSFEPDKGVQFYTNLIADKAYSQYYLWQLEETYEYRSTWPVETYWDGNKFVTHPPVYDIYFCYMNKIIPEIFIVSTANMDENIYLKFPFHFVTNKTQRLYYRYNLLVKQYAISERAYEFWNKVKMNNQTSGGLYDRQPQEVKGNVVCVSHPEVDVLGYFGVAQHTSKRINIVRNDLNHKLIYDQNLDCIQWKPERLEFITTSPKESWPIYMAPPPEDMNGLWYAPQSCTDCRLIGGVTELPEIWKN